LQRFGPVLDSHVNRNGRPTPPPKSATPFLAVLLGTIFKHSPPTAQRLRRAPNWSITHMEKTIARWSYWLGITSVVVAIAWKCGNAFGLWRALPPTPADISYWSFYNASLLFFATSIASACRVWLKSLSKELGAKRRPTKDSADGSETEKPSSLAA